MGGGWCKNASVAVQSRSRAETRGTPHKTSPQLVLSIHLDALWH